MVDEEVEIVLREIRERVISQARAEQIASASSEGNGTGAIINRGEDEASSAAELARINGYLTTTARAWDRLPPVISNRSGFTSRLELWFKARFRSLARWFTWEQVNFNAAVHHALRDTLQALLDHETQIENHRAETNALRDEVNSLRSESESSRIESQNQRTEINTLRAELHGESEARRIQIEDSQKNLQAAIQTELREQSARLSELADELRERANEQRVSFKQLSLENSEAATFQNTAWHKTESALAELDQRIKELEASVKRSK